MSLYGEAPKNPPWLNQNPPVGMTVPQQPQMVAQVGNTATVAMIQYPQAQVYQQSQIGQLQQAGVTFQAIGTTDTNQLATAGTLAGPVQPAANVVQQQLYPQLATVTYPARTSQLIIAAPLGNNTVSQPPSTHPPPNMSETPSQRVFTGTITKVQGNFGFIDGEVFFQTSCCQGFTPQVGDKVLVEATYNANMPFKWNASRVKVILPENTLPPLPPGSGRGRRFSSTPQSSFTDATDGTDSNMANDFGRRNRGLIRNRRFPIRKRPREERPREDRNKDNTEKQKEQPKSPPPRKVTKPNRIRKPVMPIRAMGQIALAMSEADVTELKKRYTKLYLPSDFILSSFKWVEVFPAHRPLALDHPCTFHIMHKDVHPVVENEAVLDPPDADYLYSAKVMLLSLPELNEIFEKCCKNANTNEESHNEHRDIVHPTYLINFLVGLRGKNETMAIGGPWSPSLDGINPDKDPKVLIKTAIRSCKALTGIDLSSCSHWYRFVEIYYHRAETIHKGKTVPARVETVVLYLPDVWSCLPTRLEWDGLQHNYKKRLDQLLAQKEEADKALLVDEVPKKQPTHYSLLEPKTMKINELRDELEARNLPVKGMTSQLIARLIKVLKTEKTVEEQENASKTEAEKARAQREKEKEEERVKREEEEKKKLAEKDKQLIIDRHTLPEKTCVVVHPSPTAKSGKFDCGVMPLDLLLDYRQDDIKENSFEVSLFAELFNEMLMRDFGFRIYRSLIEAPEKSKEDKDDKDSKIREKKSEKGRKDEKTGKNMDSENTSVDDDRSDEDRKKQEESKPSTIDHNLLIAFVYFDHSQHGYLFDKDMEELLFSLGLNLSRSQIKKLVQKVESKGLIYYRKLIEKPCESTSEQSSIETSDLEALALGNKRLLPSLVQGSSLPKRCRRLCSAKQRGAVDFQSGSVKLKGSLVDIGELQAQFKESERSRIELEKVLHKLLTDNAKLKEATRRTSSTIKDLSTQVEDVKEELSLTTLGLWKKSNKISWYVSLMSDMYEKLNPVFDETESDEDETRDSQTIGMKIDMCNSQNVQRTNVEIKEEICVKQELNLSAFT